MDLSSPETLACDFIALDPLFLSMVPSDSSVELLLSNSEQIFHEGPVLFEDKLYFTTNRLGGTSPGPTWGSTAPAQVAAVVVGGAGEG